MLSNMILFELKVLGRKCEFSLRTHLKSMVLKVINSICKCKCKIIFALEKEFTVQKNFNLTV